jgi:D-alanine-D-alanine ligase
MNGSRLNRRLTSPHPLQAETEVEAEEPPGPHRPSRRYAASGTVATAQTPRRAPLATLQLDLREDSPSIIEAPRRVRRAPIRYTDLSEVEVVVLYSLALSLERGRDQDVIADQETAHVAECVANALEGEVGAVHLAPVWDDLPTALATYDPRRHVVFNLVESLGGRAFSEPEAIRQIRAMGFNHTGVGFQSMRRSSNKLLTKRLLLSEGLPTPPYQVFHSLRDRKCTVPLPAIVKPVAEGGSFGITQDSVVREEEALFSQVEAILREYHQPALVETFIPGRELNVALWGNGQPEILPISEIVFTWTDDPLKQIVTFDAKWVAESIEYRQTPGICPADLTPEEQANVEAAALQVHRLLGLRGVARVDMRLHQGTPYILEVNSNPDLAPDAGFFRSAAAAGHTYQSMVLNILKLALAGR